MSVDQPALIPVDPCEEFFIVSNDWLRSGLPFPPISERLRLARLGYTARRGVVHIDGKSKNAIILEPRGGHDQIFADIEATARRVPPEDELPSSEVGAEDLERFVAALHSRFGLSEGILPEQCTPIAGGFVEPLLALAAGSQSQVPWVELREQSYLLISGGPGSGKTTLLRHWILWHADRAKRGDADILPLCVSLRHFQVSDTVENALRREAVEIGAPWLGRDLRAYAHLGRLAVAFDGLDEVATEERGSAIRRVAEFTRRFPDCKYLVTTRPQVGLRLDVGLLQANLLPFDRARLRQLAYMRLFETSSWKTFVTKVEAEPGLDWIVGNPLALSLIIARFLRREIKPSYINEIVAAVVDMFIDSWDANRGIVRSKTRSLSPADKRKFLGSFASAQISKGTAGEHGVLATLAEHTGLLKNGEQGSWIFQSSIFEEYFRATVWVSALISKTKEFRQLLDRPISAGISYLASFIGFMSSDAGDQIDEILRPTKSLRLDMAVNLTDLLSHSVSVDKPTLIGYAQLVAAVLEQRLADAAIHRAEAAPSDKSPSFTIVSEGMTLVEETQLMALVAALHRSRDGAGVVALLSVIALSGHTSLIAMRELLRSDGELQCTRTQKFITWKVVEILPGVPSGPAKKDLKPTSNTLH